MRRALRDSLIRPATCLVVLLAFSVSVAAQTNTGEISGVVRDAQGGALPGARVIAEHVDSGVRVEYPTDEAGRYHLLSLRVGMYVISVELPGFRRIVRSGVLVQLGQALNLDFTLDVGGPVEEIRVTASVPLLQTGSAEISDVIENQQVVQLPLNGRNFLALAQLSDAVVIPPGGTRGDSLQQAGPLPNVGGQRSGHNIYLLDGVKVTDELFNNLVINPSVDSIQEFKIQKSQYPAEFGGKASALINVATRAGANSVIRRRARRAGRTRSQLLFLQLRRTARAALADADVLGADGGGSRRRFFRQRNDLRSADHHHKRSLHAVRE